MGQDSISISVSLKSIQEIKFLYKLDFDYTQVQETSLQIGIKLETGVDKLHNICYLESYITYEYGDIVLLDVGVRLNFDINPIESVFITQGDKISISENIVANMLNTSIGTLRGIIFIKTQNTPLNKLVLPLLPIDELMKKIKQK